MNYEINRYGKFWYVKRKWWDIFSWSKYLFVAGTSPFDERAVGFLSKEIAEAAIKKYPSGKLIVDFPGLPVDPLLTKEGQEKLLSNESCE